VIVPMMESTDHASNDHVSDDASAIIATVEPPSALLIGGILGGATFLLCALLFGVRAGIVIATLAALASLVRRLPAAAIGFAVAAAITAASIAVAAFTTALIVASAIFGIALALFARARMRARVAAGITTATHGGTVAAP
jgi:hypothetical protein